MAVAAAAATAAAAAAAVFNAVIPFRMGSAEAAAAAAAVPLCCCVQSPRVRRVRKGPGQREAAKGVWAARRLKREISKETRWCCFLLHLC